MSKNAASPSCADQIARLRTTYRSGRTRDMAWRRKQLEGLQRMLRTEETALVEAMHADLGRAQRESWIVEIGPLLADIRHALENMPQWMQARGVALPLPLQPGSAQVRVEPRGVCLVVSPWNYPASLCLAPAIAALAAGNCLVLKPSELAPATSAALALLIPEFLDPDAVTVVTGGAEETTALLEQRFDTIFYTGGPRVGRIILQAAARHLTPVTLELGGKSPAIVLDDANLDVAARRIAWGKFVNAGQTCLAPDHVLVAKKVEGRLVERLVKAVHEFYGEQPQQSPDYARIVNRAHTERLAALLDCGEVATGAEIDIDDRYIAPTILRDVPRDAPVMQEEIFGPILPVVAVDSIDDAIEVVNERPDPLALYLFSADRQAQRRVLEATRSGSVVFNDVVVHYAVQDLPFGGVGESGMGAYHGVHGFNTFSHRRAVVDKWRGIDPPLRYPPYSDRQLALIKRLL